MWALRAPGVRVELRPITAVTRRRRFVGLLGHREERHAWLVGSLGADEEVELAIPVDPSEADRMVGGTAALVRGRFAPGGRVVLDFPEEVVFSTGRVIPVAADLPAEPAYASVRARADVPSRASVRWRVASAVTLALLVVIVASTDEDGEDGERCGRLPGALLDPRSVSCLDDAQFQVGSARPSAAEPHCSRGAPGAGAPDGTRRSEPRRHGDLPSRVDEHGIRTETSHQLVEVSQAPRLVVLLLHGANAVLVLRHALTLPAGRADRVRQPWVRCDRSHGARASGRRSAVMRPPPPGAGAPARS